MTANRIEYVDSLGNRHPNNPNGLFQAVAVTDGITTNTTLPDGKGVKHDEEKLPWHLAPWEAFTAIVIIMRGGAKTYGDRNWERGMQWSRLFSALQRHMTAWWIGEALDPATKKSHLWHAGCCIVFLIAYEIRGLGSDDRPSTVLKRRPEQGTLPDQERKLRDTIAQRNATEGCSASQVEGPARFLP